MRPAINGICGVEPSRDGEYPHAHAVGFGGVSEIVEELENLGDYGIKWFVVKVGENTLAKMNARHVAHVSYARPTEGGAS